MNICVWHRSLLILILIKYVKCADKPTEQPPVSSESDSDEDDNFDVIVKGVQELLEDDDDKTAGESLVSDNVIQHGLGPLMGQGYTPPTYTPQPRQPYPQPVQQYVPGPTQHQQLPRAIHYEQIRVPRPPIFGNRVPIYQPRPPINILRPILAPPPILPSSGPKSQPEITKDKDLELIKLFKNDGEGNLVEMSGKDYCIRFRNAHKIKILFRSELEKVVFKDDTIYTHLPGKPYCTEMTYNKNNSVFVFNRKGGFLYAESRENQWRIKFRNFPEFVQIYAQDHENRQFQLTEGHYYLDLTSKGSYKFSFIPGVKCTKIVINGSVVWKKTYAEFYPIIVTVTKRLNVILHFKDYFTVFGYFKGNFRKIFTKQNIEDIDDW
ncbi:SVSP family protein [Theileria parva strain Muguga]|uniref:SVSP family protein n=1 Tax=Theileria parva strain Muguga TaxID=333668 RepID=UPI001C618803|nr:SVSP family protein [Theileria parva strain Muguga]EAN30711.2 SVSP family protein [Theileria parva strain Muguga]